MTTPSTATVSQREAEVLAALGTGLSNAQIAGRLHISVRTVEGHVSSLLRKYGVADRRALAALAEAAAGGAAPGQVVGLPTFRTPFIGRTRERQELVAALEQGRLVTLVGPGGVGKTRLAAAVVEAAAPAFPLGGAFVDLVAVREGFVAQAVASVLGVTELAHRTLEKTIAERLGRGRSLLVLDNCEHLIDASAALADLLMNECPDTTILVTSRERLRVPGERVVSLAPLPIGSDADLLFVDRATAADPTFDPDPQVVSDICARLDGLPLAIELAAARCDSLGATGLLTGLGDYLRLLAGGREQTVRHRSLRSVIDWSHDLLDNEEQVLFRRLAVFAGGFDLPAAAAVAFEGAADTARTADVLGRLVDKNLVVHLRGPTSRWRLLGTIRAFAGEQLEHSGELPELRQRHLAWAADAATALESLLPDGPWRAEFDAVADDLRAALIGAAQDPDPAAHRLGRALGHLAFARRFLLESVRHHRQAARHAADPSAAAADLRKAAECMQVINDSSQMYDLLLEAADKSGAAGDENGRALALARAVEVASRYSPTFRTVIPDERLEGLLADATIAGDPGDPVVAAWLACAAAWVAGPEKLTPDRELAGKAVEAARVTGDPVIISACLDALRHAVLGTGRMREAHLISTERIGLLARMDRLDPSAAAEIDDALAIGCTDAVGAGDVRAALSIARDIMDDELLSDHPYLPASRVIPAYVLAGDIDRALELATAMWDGWRSAGRPPAFWMQMTVHFVALAYGLRGDRHNLARWQEHVAEVGSIPIPYQERLTPLATFVDARLAVQVGAVDDAKALVGRAFGNYHPRTLYRSYAKAAAAELAVVAGLPDAADRLAAAEPESEESEWAAACLARAAGRLHGDKAALATSVSRWEEIGARFERACTLLLLPERAAEGTAQLAELGMAHPAT